MKRRYAVTWILLLAIPLLAACGRTPTEAPKMAEPDSLIELNGRPVLVEFYADW